MAVIMFKAARRVLYLSTCFVLLLLLSACLYSPSKEKCVYNNGRVDLLVLYKYSVPFVSESFESVGDIEIYPVEVDDYGRTLGIMQGDQKHMDPLFGESAVYCVLQGGSEKESCFYEDSCCVVVESGLDYQEVIEQLKKDNDWNKPLLFDKCRKIPIKGYSAAGVFDTELGYKENSLLNMACKAVGYTTDNSWLDAISKDGCGLWLFALKINPGKENSPVFLIMMHEADSLWRKGDSELSVIDTHLLENRCSPWEEIRDFKENSGWTFVSSP